MPSWISERQGRRRSPEVPEAEIPVAIFNPSYETHTQRYSSLTADQKLHCAGKKGAAHHRQHVEDAAKAAAEKQKAAPHAEKAHTGGEAAGTAAAEPPAVDEELERIAQVGSA